MRIGLLILIIAFAVAAGMWAAGCGDSGSAVIKSETTLTQDPAELPAASSPAAEPAQLDLAALAAAAAPLLRDEAVLDDPSRTIHGRVLTPRGSPAAGASVNLWTPLEGWTDPRQLLGAEERDGLLTIADNEGNFRFENLTAIEYSLTAKKGDRIWTHHGAYPGQYLELHLAETGTIRGRLACAQHGAESFSGVAVLGGGFFGSGYGAVPIGADGRFELTHVPVGNPAVYVYVDRHVQISSASDDIRRQGETVDLLVKLETACTVRGKVIDVVTRAPIAGALVQQIWSDGREVRTGADGTFILTEIQMEGSSPGPPLESMFRLNHMIHAQAPGYLTGRAEVLLSKVETTAQEHACTIALYPGIPISGRIVNARGIPLPRLFVTLSQGSSMQESTESERSPDYFMTGRTDVEGRFTIAWGAGRPTLLRLYSDHLGVWTRNLGQFSDGCDLGDLQLPDPGSIPVLIVDEAGAPIPMAQLHLSMQRKEDEWELAAASQPNSEWFRSVDQSRLTDTSGRCTLLYPPAFPAKIFVTIPDGVEDWQFPVLARAGDTQEDLRLTLKGLRTITGKVRRVDKTIPKCRLTIRAADDARKEFSPRVDSDGAFRARAAFPDRFDALVSVVDPDRVGVVVFADLAFSNKPLELSLPEFLPVEGSIVDVKGFPVGHATVIARMYDKELRWGFTADDKGRFRIFVPPEGTIELGAVEHGDRRMMRFSGQATAVTAGQTGIVLVLPDPERK